MAQCIKDLFQAQQSEFGLWMEGDNQHPLIILSSPSAQSH